MYHNKNLDNKGSAGKNLFVWTFVLVVMAAIALGDVEQGPMSAKAGGSIALADVDVSGGEDKTSAGSQVQTINFRKDASIREALSFLGKMYNKNIVPSPKVDGVLAFTSLYDVTFEEAMDAILSPSLKYEQKDGLIKVYTTEEYQKIREDKTRMVQKVFTLYYVNATEMEGLIKPVLSKSATVAASTAAATDTEAGDGGNTLAMHDTLVIYDYPENIKMVAEMVREIDVKPSAVLIEVSVLEAELKDETEFGIDFSSIAGASMSVASSEGITTSGFASGVTGSAGFTAAFSIDDVTGFIRAVESITDVTVLANPKILALNKQAGHILIGESDGYLTTTQVTAEGRVQQVDFLESGTKLKFRPYICRDGYIRMEINPEQSSGQVSVLGDYVLPSKQTTEVKTNIMVKDGKTIVIGGLFKEKTDQTYSQVPILGDLPLIGPIFRQTHDTSTRTELIILITPHIIYEPQQTHGDKEAEEVKIITEGARKSLNLVNRSRIFGDRYKRALKYYKKGYLDAALSELDSILKLRPNFPDASLLREKIIGEMNADAMENK